MPEIVPAKKYVTKSLISVSLEIGRVLADRDGVTFRAIGTCMYPTVRPGDVLRIQSRAAADVSVGDIALFRKSNHLFCHRVVDKGLEGGRNYVITVPDRIPDESDGPTFDENLLGVVETIERRGKSVPLQPAVLSIPKRFYFFLSLLLMDIIMRGYYWWSGMFERVQDSFLYRRLARKLLRFVCPHVSFNIRLPMPGMGDAIFRRLLPEAFKVQMLWMGRPVERWTLTLHLNGAPQPAAWVTFAREAEDTWSVEELFVCRRYRGAGLDEMLLGKADVILKNGPHKMQEKDQDVAESQSFLRTSPGL